MRGKVSWALLCALLVLVTTCVLSFRQSTDDSESDIGDVRYSILEPGAFLRRHPGWILLAGQKVDSTELASLGIHELPDARAMFIRGMNFDRKDMYADPEKSRSIKTVQASSVQQHQHSFNGRILQAEKGTGFDGHGFESNSREGTDIFKTIENEPGLATETRPNNIALYIYVKIK